MLAETMATKKTKKPSGSGAAPAKKNPKALAKKRVGTSLARPKGPAAKKSAVKTRPAKKGAAKTRPANKSAAKTRPAKKGAVKTRPAKKGAVKKSVAKRRPAPSSSAAAKPAPVVRRDGAGHLDAKYATTLREKSREGHVRDGDEAFIGRAARSKDDLAEAMGETWVETATSGEDENEDVFNQRVPEDEGGPFVTTTAGQEFAEGTDASNPKRSKREPFPKT